MKQIQHLQSRLCEILNFRIMKQSYMFIFYTSLAIVVFLNSCVREVTLDADEKPHALKLENILRRERISRLPS